MAAYRCRIKSTWIGYGANGNGKTSGVGSSVSSSAVEAAATSDGPPRFRSTCAAELAAAGLGWRWGAGPGAGLGCGCGEGLGWAWGAGLGRTAKLATAGLAVVVRVIPAAWLAARAVAAFASEAAALFGAGDETAGDAADIAPSGPA